MSESSKKRRLAIYILLCLIILIMVVFSDDIFKKTYFTENELFKEIQRYYEYEKTKEWVKAFKARTPQFKKVVALDTYIRIMNKDSRGWQLLQINVIDIVMRDQKAYVEISFIDKCPEDYLPGSGITSIKTQETTLWEKNNGAWYVKNPGGRGYLSLNIDLVDPE